VLVDGFLASREAHVLLLPRLPLQEWIDGRLGSWLAGRGVNIHRGTPVRQIDGDGRAVAGVLLADGRPQPFDAVIAAVPWHQVGGLLGPALSAGVPSLADVEKIEPAAITAVHLWFDRPLSPLPHAVLVDRLSQWVFADRAESRARHGPDSQSGHHYQVVISGSHALPVCQRADILGEVRRDLEAVWPAAREAKLLNHRVIVHATAVFSSRPGVERFRPPQQTPVANLFLAGDWTATGWPGTMEGAVRSGRLAAEAMLRSLGTEVPLLAADLPRGFLARRLLG
jgi:uncharacterized protein with NAD-binding domain and iron-sulfur cluster